MKTIIKTAIALICLMPPLTSGAFTSNGIIYNIVSSSNRTVEVGSRSSQSAGSDGSVGYEGNITIPDKVTYSGYTYTVIGIGAHAFRNSSVTSLTLPSTITYFGQEAFSTCFDLAELTIPASVTSIGASCFWVCPDLKHVYALGNNPASCGSQAFSYMQYNNATLHVPYGRKSTYQQAGGWKDFPTIVEMNPNHNSHEYVDLNLPSGKLWATTNYGASSPTGYGTYVEWSSNDIVKNNWGGRWYTPSLTDMRELMNNCTWTWSSQNGVKGYTVKGSNGNSIFLPAAGVYMGSAMRVGEWVYYWTSTSESSSMVYNLMATQSSVAYGSMNTMAQLPIRPVMTPEQSNILCTSISLNRTSAELSIGETLQLTATVLPGNATNKTVTWKSSNPSIAYVSSTGRVAAAAPGTANITATTTDGSNLSTTCRITVKSNAPSVEGDVNNDGTVDIADVNVVINVMLGKATNPYSDVTGDGNTDIADENAVINLMLGKGGRKPVTYTVNGVSFTMVAVQGGTFTMGATAEQGSDAYDEEKPAHLVTLSNYSIGQTEVTQELWQAVMGSNPSCFTGDLQRPVEQVSWNDCQTFINKLNQMTGKNFRLPTEAEWEYAARGGNRSQGYKYVGSNTVGDVAWYGINSSSTTHLVGTKASNELGLYDMSGNVWEWCQDWYGSYSSDAQTNPTGPASGSLRVARGGGWRYIAGNCRVSFRSYASPSATDFSLGLRLAL